MEKLFIDQQYRWDWCQSGIYDLENYIADFHEKIAESIRLETTDNLVHYAKLTKDFTAQKNHIRLQFGSLINSLRAILDNAMIYIINNHCPDFNPKYINDIYFPIFANKDKWDKRRALYAKKYKIPLKIIEMIEHVQPYKGFLRSVSNPNENIISLLKDCDNQIKHKESAQFTKFICGCTTFEFLYKISSNTIVNNLPDITICHSELNLNECIARIAFTEPVTHLKVTKFNSDDLLIKIYDGREIYVLGGLKNMSLGVRVIVETIELALTGKNSFLGIPFAHVSNLHQSD